MADIDDFVPISALQHVVFCARQAALIHVERVWVESGLTARGRVLHERTDDPGTDLRRGTRVDRALHLRSDRLGVQGIADCVEWVLTDGVERPRPVETKKGRLAHRRADEVQLCAQAMCLEEMVGVEVPIGVLYYAGSHRRTEVLLGVDLRAATVAAARRVHEMMKTGVLPAPEQGRKCRSCSLLEACQPERMQRGELGRRYLDALLFE